MQDAKQQAKWIRHFRWLHRKIAIVLFSFFLLIAISGFLLGWKKIRACLRRHKQAALPNFQPGCRLIVSPV